MSDLGDAGGEAEPAVIADVVMDECDLKWPRGRGLWLQLATCTKLGRMLAVAMARMEAERKEETRKGAWREEK